MIVTGAGFTATFSATTCLITMMSDTTVDLHVSCHDGAFVLVFVDHDQIPSANSDRQIGGLGIRPFDCDRTVGRIQDLDRGRFVACRAFDDRFKRVAGDVCGNKCGCPVGHDVCADLVGHGHVVTGDELDFDLGWKLFVITHQTTAPIQAPLMVTPLSFVTSTVSDLTPVDSKLTVTVSVEPPETMVTPVPAVHENVRFGAWHSALNVYWPVVR